MTFLGKKIEDEYAMEQPLSVEALSQLAVSQGQDFWMRELCIQIAALRQALQDELQSLRDTIRDYS